MREVGSDGDMAAPCFRERETQSEQGRERSPHQCRRQKSGLLQRARGGQVSEGHAGQEAFKVAQVVSLNIWAVNFVQFQFVQEISPA